MQWKITLLALLATLVILQLKTTARNFNSTETNRVYRKFLYLIARKDI